MNIFETKKKVCKGCCCCCCATSVMSDSVQPHRRQPSRLPHPWDSPGKNTAVGCHFLLQCMKGKRRRGKRRPALERAPTTPTSAGCGRAHRNSGGSAGRHLSGPGRGAHSPRRMPVVRPARDRGPLTATAAGFSTMAYSEDFKATLSYTVTLTSLCCCAKASLHWDCQ